MVVGGKNADQNEKLVKTYLKDKDYYFHTEDNIGGGSFVLFQKENESPSAVDFDETAEGVLCFSNSWNQSKTGKVFYVEGQQVSKTPQSGEYIAKGSFIIRGKRNFINVQNTTLGYCLTEKNELMMAPFRIIKRLAPDSHVKISNGSKKWKSKDFINNIEKTLGIVWQDKFSQFHKPCLIQYIGRK